MIDLVLHTTDQATLATWAKTHGLMREVKVRDTDPESPTFGEMISQDPPEWQVRRGVEWCWWAGSGRMMRARGTYDEEGNELTPPQYVAGMVALLRLSGEFFNEDRIEAEPDAEQWARSKVVKYIKDNGQIGQTGGIAYVEMDGVRVFRPSDVQAKLSEWGVPGHEWLGGNVF